MHGPGCPTCGAELPRKVVYWTGAGEVVTCEACGAGCTHRRWRQRFLAGFGGGAGAGTLLLPLVDPWNPLCWLPVVAFPFLYGWMVLRMTRFEPHPTA